MRSLIVAMIPLMVACTAPTSDAQEMPLMQEIQRTLSVSGEGRAAAAPDLAMLNFGVQAQGKTAAEALAANARLMSNVTQAVKGMGVEPRDLQTSGFSLSPLYSRDDRGRADTNVIIGYQTFNTLTVRLRNIEKVGEAIDKVVGAGANNFNGLSFGFQDSAKLMEEARRNAVRDARAVAELMAEEAGVKLGAVLTMGEQTGRPSPQPMMMARSMESDMASTPIEAGESEMVVRVHITYSLK